MKRLYCFDTRSSLFLLLSKSYFNFALALFLIFYLLPSPSSEQDENAYSLEEELADLESLSSFELLEHADTESEFIFKSGSHDYIT